MSATHYEPASAELIQEETDFSGNVLRVEGYDDGSIYVEIRGDDEQIGFAMDAEDVSAFAQVFGFALGVLDGEDA